MISIKNLSFLLHIALEFRYTNVSVKFIRPTTAQKDIQGKYLRPNKDGSGASGHLYQVLEDESAVDQHLALDQEPTCVSVSHMVEQCCESRDEEGEGVRLDVAVL